MQLHAQEINEQRFYYITHIKIWFIFKKTFLNFIHPNRKLGPSRAVFLTGSLFWPLHSAYYLSQGIYWKVPPNMSLQIQFLSNFWKYSFISPFLPISTVLANFERGGIWLGKTNGPKCCILVNHITQGSHCPTIGLIRRFFHIMGHSSVLLLLMVCCCCCCCLFAKYCCYFCCWLLLLVVVVVVVVATCWLQHVGCNMLVATCWLQHVG